MYLFTYQIYYYDKRTIKKRNDEYTFSLCQSQSRFLSTRNHTFYPSVMITQCFIHHQTYYSEWENIMYMSLQRENIMYFYGIQNENTPTDVYYGEFYYLLASSKNFIIVFSSISFIVLTRFDGRGDMVYHPVLRQTREFLYLLTIYIVIGYHFLVIT